MFRPRIIPVLLLKGRGLVKTIRFSASRYIGDPINAVKIFNDLGADELVFLDITASYEKRTISSEIVKEIGDEAYMPFSVGGGISTVEQIGSLLSYGAEKVVLNTNAVRNMQIIREASSVYGNQSIIVSIDVKKSLFKINDIYINSGKEKTNLNLIDYVKQVTDAGAGEILINSIDRDGTYKGYDIDLIKKVSANTTLPVIACGGAASLIDMKDAFIVGGASACAAGSLFVYHGPRRAVLVNYPEKFDIQEIFKNVI
jgi:cyclase